MMHSDDAVRDALGRYDEPLLRSVAARLFKPRSQWPVDELVTRAVETLANTPVVDRRLKDLPPSCRALLATIGLTRHREWPVGRLLELLSTLGHAEGLAPVLQLLDAGLLMPVLPPTISQLRSWEAWLGPTPTLARVVVPDTVAERATRESTGLPALPGKPFEPRGVVTADGLEWLLRLGVLWQQLRTTPIRLTQTNALFKRDQTRLETDALLAAALGEAQADVPDPGVLTMAMGMASGLFVAEGGELRAGTFPPSWDTGPAAVVGDLWRGIPAMLHWDPLRGYYLTEAGEPFPTVIIPALLLLAVQAPDVWTHPAEISGHLHALHPNWSATTETSDDAEAWVEAAFLGWALPLGVVEAAQDGEGWWVRLTDVGRHLLAGGALPERVNHFERCLVVQPNGDVIAYRQGLTSGLIAKLSRFADWKMIGPACTLGLSAESVYRGLESGLTLSDIVAVLQQHSGHPVPANVIDLIRRWAGKRDRITVHPSATLLEFNTPEELEHAMSRGLVAQKLTDRIGLAEGEVDYKHFRLLGNRDYEAKPQRCAKFMADGVTFAVDMVSADLLLEAEVSRIAEPVPALSGERRFRITPATARTAREQGVTIGDLDSWCQNRAGEPLSASARLLFSSGTVTGEVRPRLVLTLPTPEVTDGVCQWPDTADLLEDRLGPTAVAVVPDNLDELLRRLLVVGVEARRVDDLRA